MNVYGWSYWSADKETPALKIEPGAGIKGSHALSGASVLKTAVASQKISVKPGEHYLVRGYARTEGNGKAQMRIFWQHLPGKWLWDNLTPIITLNAEPGPDGWMEFLEYVVIPPRITDMGIILDFPPLRSGVDKVYYDNIQAYKISEAPANTQPEAKP